MKIIKLVEHGVEELELTEREFLDKVEEFAKHYWIIIDGRFVNLKRLTERSLIGVEDIELIPQYRLICVCGKCDMDKINKTNRELKMKNWW